MPEDFDDPRALRAESSAPDAPRKSSLLPPTVSIHEEQDKSRRLLADPGNNYVVTALAMQDSTADRRTVLPKCEAGLAYVSSLCPVDVLMISTVSQAVVSIAATSPAHMRATRPCLSIARRMCRAMHDTLTVFVGMMPSD